jgi:hypothetical protein
MAKRGRGRPKKSEKKVEPKIEIEERVEPKIEEKIEPKIEIEKKVEPKVEVKKIKALMRITHRGKTYEEGDTFVEEDQGMVDQIVKKGFGVEV